MSDLRTATQDIHHRAEETGISKMLISGDFTKEEWKAFLSNQLIFRNAIEDRNIIKMPEVLTVPRILADLAVLGADGNDDITDATRAYATYLLTLDEAKVWSHIYVIYLGDLYGGQVIRKALEKALPVSMLTFEDRQPLIAYVRQNIADASEEEAVHAFEWIIRIYEELYQNLRG